MHTHCMPDPVDHIARGHTDSTPCVPCQSARSEGSRPLHPAELTRGLPMTEQGRRWTAVRSALQFAALLQRGDLGTEPPRYVTARVHTTFELTASTFGRSPTSSFVLCSHFSDALDLPQGACLDFPRTRDGKRLPPTTVRYSPRTVLDRRISYSDSQIGDYTLDLTFKRIWRALTPHGRDD